MNQLNIKIGTEWTNKDMELEEEDITLSPLPGFNRTFSNYMQKKITDETYSFRNEQENFFNLLIHNDKTINTQIFVQEAINWSDQQNKIPAGTNMEVEEQNQQQACTPIIVNQMNLNNSQFGFSEFGCFGDLKNQNYSLQPINKNLLEINKQDQFEPIKQIDPLKQNASFEQQPQMQRGTIELRSQRDDTSIHSESRRKVSIKNYQDQSPSPNHGEQRLIFGCNCKKSKCLKLYCECFASQNFCSEFCNCSQCGNYKENKNQRKRAIQDAVTRNPEAFNNKYAAVTAIKGSNSQQEKKNTQLKREEISFSNNTVQTDEERNHPVFKGCSCQQTQCLQKYCECFFSGLKCGSNCKCQGCQNMETEDQQTTNQTAIHNIEFITSNEQLLPQMPINVFSLNNTPSRLFNYPLEEFEHQYKHEKLMVC